MKTAFLAMLALLALVPAVGAQTWCEESCCEESSGTWDSGSETCDFADSSYYTCLSDYCSSASYDTGASGSSGSSSGFSCCGSGLILASVGFAAFIGMNRKAAQ